MADVFRIRLRLKAFKVKPLSSADIWRAVEEQRRANDLLPLPGWVKATRCIRCGRERGPIDLYSCPEGMSCGQPRQLTPAIGIPGYAQTPREVPVEMPKTWGPELPPMSSGGVVYTQPHGVTSKLWN